MRTCEEISKELNLPVDKLQRRADGRVEWVCEHGVGHTVYNPNDWGEYTYVHGCDGCCTKIRTYAKNSD